MHKQQFSAIPVLDMRSYRHGSQHDKEQFSQQLCNTCHHVGFFYLKNHGVSTRLMREVLSFTKLFFALPEDDKYKVDITHSPHFRGYGKLEAEATSGAPDYKETYDLGIERCALDTPEQPYQILHGPNQWPSSSSLPQIPFRHTILEYINKMLHLGREIMIAIAIGLGIQPDEFLQGFHPENDDAFAMLRLLHYPPANPQNKNQFGVGPHVDAGCLVFLLQDHIGGLQVQNHEGNWIDAPPLADTFIVNIGEMLQLLSNHHFSATPHRALNHTSKHRFSAPFFFEPNLSTVVKPISPPSEHQTPRDSMTYGEHMLQIYQRSFPGHS